MQLPLNHPHMLLILTLLLIPRSRSITFPSPLPFTPPTCTDTYLAPLVCGEKRDIVQGRYIIYLYPRYTLALHVDVIGVDVEDHVDHVYEGLFPDRVVYVSLDVEDEVLEAVRRDEMVEFVECVGRVWPCG